MGTSSEKSEPSPTSFHVSLSNLILGQNPVVLTGTTEESDSTSGETSETTSAEWSSDAESGRKVVLIPVESLEDSTADESSVTYEKIKKKQNKKEKSSKGDNQVICQKKKNKVKGKDGAEGNTSSDNPDETSSRGETTTTATDQSKDADSDCSKAKRKKKKNYEDASPDQTVGTDSTETADTSGDASQSAGETSVKAASTENTASSTTDWSMSEDALLRSMKEGGESWADIAKAMQRGKSDVKARWKVVEKQPRLDGGDDGEVGGETRKNEKHNGEGKEKGEKEQSKENGKGNKKDKEQAGKSEKSAKKDDSLSHQKHKPEGNGESREKGKGKPASRPSSTSESSLDEGEHEDDLYEQRAYLRHHIHASLYPVRLTLEPDAAFSASDCEVLARVDAKYHAGRWLEMQANFYGATGRWVPLHIMRAKCEASEREELSTLVKEAGNKGDNLVEKVVGWMNGVQ